MQVSVSLVPSTSTIPAMRFIVFLPKMQIISSHRFMIPMIGSDICENTAIRSQVLYAVIFMKSYPSAAKKEADYGRQTHLQQAFSPGKAFP